MTPLRLTIPGTPTAKGRPRFARATGRAFTPAKTRRAEETFAGRVAAAVAASSWQRPEGKPALGLRALFVLPVPASWSKRKREAALACETYPVGRPDVDNLVKLVVDACNGLLWDDDAQIVTMTTSKVYGDSPRVEVWVDEVYAPRGAGEGEQ